MNIEKSVLISVQPKWCGLVANHIKTREIRKNKPQLQPPFKCYIYCTKAKQRFTHGGIVETLDDLFRMPNGKIKYGYSGELKRQGVKAGVPDLCLPVARGKYHGLYIEMKAGKNTPSDLQKDWLKALNEQGFLAVVCYGWEKASEVLIQYLEGRIDE